MRTNPTWLVLLLPALSLMGCGDKDDTYDSFVEGDTDTDTDADSDTDADADADTDADTDTQPPPAELEWCSLDRPAEVTVSPGEDSSEIYGMVSVPDYSDGKGASSAIGGELGYGELDSDPSSDPSAWNWVTASWSADSSDFDEYAVVLNIAAAGTYAYAYRFTVDEGDSWLYCDLEGSAPDDAYDVAEQGVATIGRDEDGDGYLSEEDGFDDCDDTNASIYPGAEDTPLDEVDQDCDGADALPSIDDLVAGDLVITEVHPDSDAVADQYGEWFEVYNASGEIVDLLGLQAYDDGTELFEVEDSLVVDADSLVVFGRDGDSTTNGGVTVDYEYSGFVLSNTTDAIYLDNGVEIIDELGYDSTWPFDPGVSMALDPLAWDTTSNDDVSEWCASTTAFGDGDLGTPADENEECPPEDIDLDDDGYDDVAWGGTDCDDSDATINPGAAEVCDGADNDCDGTTDVGATDATDWYEDADGDGYGDAAGTAVTDCTVPSTGYVADDTDCDDTDATVNPGATDTPDDGIDQDCDGSDATSLSDDDGDGYTSDVDCDDTDASVNPGAAEVCDGVDNDCDGTIDGSGSTDATTWYIDGDGDGYGATGLTVVDCTAPTGFVADGTDCNDFDATINPGATEVCGDGIDQDCDGSDLSCSSDADSDGYDSVAAGGTDCDDTDATINPGATEVCGDGIDQDCDGSDLSCSTTLTIADLTAGDLVITEFMANPDVVPDAVGEWFEVYNTLTDDVDLEGLVVSDNYASFTVVGSLIIPAGDYLVFGLEDDTSLSDGVPVDYEYSGPALATSGDELVLNNGTIDIDEVVYDGTWAIIAAYSKQLDSSSLDATSNDDAANWCDATLAYGTFNHGTPGSANDACSSGATDADGDGYIAVADGGTDCDDTDATINPGATEVCDSVDNDCDGDTDEGLGTTYYADDDGDGYGDATNPIVDCWSSPTGYVSDDTDCDDTDSSVHPGATEVCGDGIDQDCDGSDLTCASVSLEWCNVQWVGGAAAVYAIATGDSVDTYGQVFATGVTDSTGPGSGITAEVGYGATGGDPSVDPSMWTWTSASYNTDVGYNDEYTVAITPADPGYLAVAYRFSGDGGTSWSYCDAGGTTISSGDIYVPSDEWSLTVGTDGDGDGYFDTASGGDDCDDSDATVNPGATDSTTDGIDQDCDGTDGTATVFAVTDLIAGDLVITEFMADPSAVTDTYGEWFEVYNASGGDVDLEGLVLYDLGSNTHTVSGSLIVSDGDYVVFGRNDDTSVNGGVTVDYEYGSSWSLSNGDDEIVLNNGTIDIDDVIYDSSWTITAGAALQLDPASTDATSNDDMANWCDATTAYSSGDYGTPGTVNDSCGSSYTFTHDADIQPLWDSLCTSCHNPAGLAGGLDLSDGYTAMVGVASSQLASMDLVEAGDSSLSYAWHKLDGTQASVGGMGAAMPAAGSITRAQLDVIETWINEGAPE